MNGWVVNLLYNSANLSTKSPFLCNYTLIFSLNPMRVKVNTCLRCIGEREGFEIEKNAKTTSGSFLS